jgi:hypothetical protein
MLGNSCVAAQMVASQEGLRSMKLIIIIIYFLPSTDSPSLQNV